MHINGLVTPAALIDEARLVQNVDRMAARASGLGVSLRPHFKTHKCAEIAALQARRGCHGFTVSTLAEARCLQRAGFDDITYAVPMVPSKLAAALELRNRGTNLHLLVDSLETALGPSGVRRSPRRPVRRLRQGRLRVPPCRRRPRVRRGGSGWLACSTDCSHLALSGLLTHAGHSPTPAATGPRPRRWPGRRRRRDGAPRCRSSAGQACRPGPSASDRRRPSLRLDHLEGVDEARPGNAVFFDVFQAAVGSTTQDNIAMAVLASVVGVYPARGQAVVDAGALALSKDQGPNHLEDCGFGLLADCSMAPAEQTSA
jgi:D-serine deaminase-like pyridoxal phosphate-dependent protein